MTTSATTAAARPGDNGVEHLDVLIVGAGLSGVGAAWRLRREHPGRTIAILEARDAIGGTWDLFRYPGVRSDSDMFTLSYPFRPWRGEHSIATGESIRDYIRDTAAETGIERLIRFRTRVVGASWSSADARWTVRTEVAEADGTTSSRTCTCSFLFLCTGYYSYDHGHQPEFPGRDDFAGRFVHPQFWPVDLDHSGKRVVVIGSGATAVTLVPAMAETAAHVTMLQRSPSYVAALPGVDKLADLARRRLPADLAHRLVRAKNVLFSQAFYQLARRRPTQVRKALRDLALRFLDPTAVDEHFTPAYDPWDQRLCLAPDGDFYRAIADAKATVVTERIDRFVESGIRLASGKVLEADIIVSATGLDMLAFGGVELTVDGRHVDPGATVAYRGLMLGDVPNLAFSIGYVNASWTLRSDLAARYVCRLLGHMDRRGWAVATPTPKDVGRQRPLLDLTSGYALRGAGRFPKQGERGPWTVRSNYPAELLSLPRADLRRDMTFAPRATARRAQPAEVTA
ncbi:flavin-containing monooxygenase [Pseudonocardia humida]|uniref:flavin-containing monooxygenase n=1 Tax=Pseudonocardia humida TaxID=2800819 RepID=UPI00207C7BA1|nr:NAD(P)/FAD-dependent oxidoreductase [Pseudonocardia humida]